MADTAEVCNVDITSVYMGSGATYIGQHSATYARRDRLSTSHPYASTCDKACGMASLCGLCVSCRCLFCPGSMTPRNRVYVLWFWVITFTLLTWLVCKFVFFGTFLQTVAVTDMRIASEGVSPVFCSSLSLQSTVIFTTFVFDKPPTVDLKRTEYFDSHATDYVTIGSFFYRKFYLLEGSVINVLSCADVGVALYVIKGQNNFKIWKNNKDCHGCAIGNQNVVAPCFRSNRDNYTLTVVENEDYYFVYANYEYDTWVRADFKGRRTLYNTNGSRQECDHQMTCDVDLDIGLHQVVVYHMSDGISPDNLSMETTCNMRIWSCIILFLLVPMVLGCILSVLTVLCAGNRRNLGPEIRPSRRRMSRFPNERTPLIRGESPPYRALDPPKYEDAVSDSNNVPPPSYEQATT